MKIRFIHLLSVLYLVSSVEAGAYTDADCIDCHGRPGKGSMLKMSVEQFNSSVHGGEVSCRECHAGVLDEDHQETVGSGAVNCTECHEQDNRHGTGVVKSGPKCFDCHTRHHILAKDDPLSSVHGDRLQQTCRACHPAQSSPPDYLSWSASIQIASHPKQDFSQIYTRRNCLGCHQGKAAHGEPDPISEQNCHSCHLKEDGKNKLLGVMHPDANPETQPGVFVAAVTYQVALVIMVFGGFGWLVRRFAKVAKRKE